MVVNLRAKGVVFTAPEHVEVLEVEVPEPTPNDVIIRILYSGVSIGTERWILTNKYKGVSYPLVSGYQFCGIIEKTGSNVTSLHKGDMVFARHSRILGNIRPMWAGHVSYAVVDAAQVLKVPEGVDPAEASLAVMPAVSWHGIQLTKIYEGDLVIVIGMGLIGQMTAQLARILGARVIALEVLEKRRKIAELYSADVALNPLKDDVESYVRKEKEEGADVIIDTSANADIINASFSWIRHNGRYCLQGYYPGLTCIDLFLPHVKQITFFNPTDCEGIDKMLKFIAQRKLKLKPLITQQFNAEDAPKAYELMLKHPEEVLSIVLKWSN
jgi:2-desacetyl-2-hydroxyethyl bacteriochlorophyllide A dehydrogenase